MKLVSCHIVAFGGLSDVSFNFSQNLNVICEHNGWGKTTLAAFIKAMLYGLSGENKQTVSSNEFLKFKPLAKDGKFGGSLTFLFEENEYRVTRFFLDASKSKKTIGEYEIVDTKTNRKVDFAQPLGETLLGINAQAFERTCYLPQKEIVLKSDKDPQISHESINNKLSTLLYNTSTENNFAVVMDRLNGIRKEYKLKKGEGGSIFVADRQADQLRQSIFRAEQSVRSINSLTEELEGVRGRLKASEGQLKTTKDKLAHALTTKSFVVVANNFDKMNEQFEQLSTQKEGCERIFGSLDEKELQAVERDATSYSVDRAIHEREKLNAKQVKPQSKFLRILSIILTVITLGLFKLIVRIFKSFSRAKEGDHYDASQVAATETMLATKREQLVNFLTTYGASEQFIEREEFADGVRWVRTQFDRYIALSQKVCEQQAQLHQYYEENAQQIEQGRAVKENDDEDSLRQAEQQISQHLMLLRREETVLCQKISQEQIRADSLDQLRAELETQEEQISVLTEELTVIDNCITFLERAKQNLQTAYLPALQKNFEHYLTLAGLKGDMFVLDDDRNVSVKIASMQRDTNYLSLGNKDIVEFCARLALCDCLSNQSSFLILDDPFINLDDNRQDLAMKLIKKLSQRYQIIYLVCHTSRA